MQRPHPEWAASLKSWAPIPITFNQFSPPQDIETSLIASMRLALRALFGFIIDSSSPDESTYARFVKQSLPTMLSLAFDRDPMQMVCDFIRSATGQDSVLLLIDELVKSGDVDGVLHAIASTLDMEGPRVFAVVTTLDSLPLFRLRTQSGRPIDL
jgi:hypothetical protein